jgi:signal transduction histidine kinase
MASRESPPHMQTLDVVVELISRVDAAARDAPRAFYDRLCEGICLLTSMTRAGLVLYDDTRKLVLPVGSHGVEPWLLDQVHGTLEETPVAQTALAEDRVVVVSGDLASHIPARYADFPGVTTITCTPVSAAGRWLGVIFADRGGVAFELTAEERTAMWTLGKTAALAASVRMGTTAHERSQLLSQRVDLAREVHDRVMQRLFGVSLVLGSDIELGPAERRRAADELQEAVADLRTVLARPPEAVSPGTGSTLHAELDRLGRHYEQPIEVRWPEGVEVPEGVEGLAQSVLAEALRNATKHAEPTRLEVTVDASDGAFVLEVANDGATPGQRGAGAGMGLRLAALDALARGGVLEFGSVAEGAWRVRLVVPLEPPE